MNKQMAAELDKLIALEALEQRRAALKRWAKRWVASFTVEARLQARLPSDAAAHNALIYGVGELVLGPMAGGIVRVTREGEQAIKIDMTFLRALPPEVA